MNLLIEANTIFRDENIKHDSVGPLIFNTTLISGGDQVNSIPDHAEAEINARTIPEYDNQKIIDVLNDLIKKYNSQGAQISFDPYTNEYPVLMDPKNALVAPMKKLMEQYTDKEVHVSPISPVTDASNLVKNKPKNLPFLITGPGNDTPHQVNEHVDKQMYFNFIDIYEKLFIDFLDSTK
jgi:Acetylornithine deacetylase/Succinyl-diaminopimelate desuccinylase and related deacylases